MKRLYHLICAIAALAVCSAAMSADLPTTDAAGLQKLASANEAIACSQERSAVAGTASGCTDSACRIAIAAITALTQCSGAVAARMAPASAPQIINAAPPQTMGERILSGIGWGLGKLFDAAVAVGPSYLNMRVSNHQSDNATRLGIAQSANALAATQSTNNTFAAFGNNLQGTAAAGFGAAANIATTGFATAGALGSRPTTHITTGDGSPVTIGTGNAVNVQLGDGNRQGSPGPCTANGGSTTTGSNSSTAQAPCTN